MKTRVNVPFRPVYPSPAGLIVSIDENKKPNVMTAGEIFNISLKDPCIIGIALRKATYTHDLICASKEFTVNFPTVEILHKMDLVGTTTGRNGLDKFEEYGLMKLKSDVIDSPIIAECPVNLECKMLSVTEVGDHDLFFGEVVAMHVDSDKLGENQRVLIEKVDGFLFAEWGYYKFGEKLGDFGFASKNVKRSH
ncbi:MAG: flavin reductase family protein [Defluviitaleaceae bacterium]|nr:flavin reductase family protein [Defluviitaleaceae bacterium]